MKTIAELEAAMRATGVHVVSLRLTPKGPVANIRETEMRWAYGKPAASLGDALGNYFGPPCVDDMEDLLG